MSLAVPEVSNRLGCVWSRMTWLCLRSRMSLAVSEVSNELRLMAGMVKSDTG